VLLTGFQVESFRSIDKSEWIDVEDVTALIGTNESGKTNLLCALWKLNPASEDGNINLLTDAPRKLYSQLRASDKRTVFIRTEFLLEEDEYLHVSQLRKRPLQEVKRVSISRRYNGMYVIDFPDEKTPTLNQDIFHKFIDEKSQYIRELNLLKSENEEKRDTFSEVFNQIDTILDSAVIDKACIEKALSLLSDLHDEKAPKTSELTKILNDTENFLKLHSSEIDRPSEDKLKESRQYVLSILPTFVYYSNYGNLDSEIYLPHVIENMTRTDLGAKESAKVKTLKVLFDYVKLKPQDILDLGRSDSDDELSDEEIELKSKEKKERSILLQSASTELTAKFRDWWKQGEYRFRFEADGNHFRIWVSDDKRPEDIELEGRSTGLQWFLSFYLTFLVESKDSHKGSILLLDEPGLSLHPLAQKDLSLFFRNLSKTNLILYTTHSPFLVDSNHLDRVKAVFIQDDGTTNISSNLRANEANSSQTKSIYPVHAALGLSVSEMLFNNCTPILVEGPSDQIYLSAIKTLLIAFGELKPKKDIIFIPAGGTRGVKPIVSLLTGKNEELPKILLDSDSQGEQMAQALKKDLYKDSAENVIGISEIIGIEQAEIEDLIPIKIMIKMARYQLRPTNPDIEFEDVYEEGKPLLKQLEKFAQDNDISLQKGWKVDFARLVKNSLLKMTKIDTDDLLKWKKLFERISV
jgi:predicted ATP-dependent endonuclease of OLD family